MTATPTSTFNPSADGYDFSTDASVTVLPGVVVGSGQQYGVASGLVVSNLLNEGVIYSDHAYGVALVSLSGVTNGEITNAPDGIIFGPGGVYMESDVVGNLTFDNSGTVIGTASQGIFFDSVSAVTVNNNGGSIAGAQDGILLASAAGGTINNHAMIDSAKVGIAIQEFFAGGTTVINNFKGGVIQGTIAAINEASSTPGNFRLVNHGTVIGNVDNGNNASDVIINPGKITGTIELGSGNCLFNGTGGTSGAIVANGGNARIIAGKGNLLIELGGGQQYADRRTGPRSVLLRCTAGRPGRQDHQLQAWRRQNYTLSGGLRWRRADRQRPRRGRFPHRTARGGGFDTSTSSTTRRTASSFTIPTTAAAGSLRHPQPASRADPRRLPRRVLIGQRVLNPKPGIWRRPDASSPRL
jgi:hypothetical protein